MSSSRPTVPCEKAAHACFIPVLKVHSKNRIKLFGFSWLGLCVARQRKQDTELPAKEGASQVGQPGDDDSLQGQRRRAWTP